MQQVPRSLPVRLEQQERALELRISGATYEEIGRALGVKRSRAHKIVAAAIRALNEKLSEQAEEVRRLELERLDRMTLALFPDRGNPRAADSLLRIMDRRAKLLGLDAPEKHAHMGPNGQAIPAPIVIFPDGGPGEPPAGAKAP